MPSPTFEIKSKAVRAGAGAGKTHNLTHQVLDFATSFKQHEGRWPRVLVTTFTRKATQELSERLIKLAMQEKPDAVEFVSSTQYLSVSTIHGILDRFLKQWGHTIGLKSDFGYMKPNEAAHAAKKILKGLSGKAANYGPLFTAFSFSHLRALLIESLEHDLNGYTPVNETDLRHLLGKHLEHLRLELVSVLDQTEGHEASDKLREVWAAARRLPPLLSLEGWDSNYATVVEIIESLKLTGIRVKADSPLGPVHDQFKAVLEDLRELSDSIYDPAAFANLSTVNRYFSVLRKDFKDQFEGVKKASSKIEISDLENFALSIVREFPQAAKAFSVDTDYWLIDEFQDTSPLQLQILEFLIGKKPYYLVGDPQQSIYLFRGARSEVFRDKAAEIQTTGGVLDVLDTNYRSAPELLNFINALSESLGPQFQPMNAAPKDHGPVQEAAQFIIVGPGDNDSKKDNNEWQEAVEMETLFARVMELRNEGVSFEQMSVLLRKNSQLEKLGAFLNSRGLPVHLHSSGLFWERREVQDAVALLKFFLNPHDDVNLVKLLRAPFFASTDKQLAEKLNGRKSGVWTLLREPMKTGELGQAAQALYKGYMNARTLGIIVTFQRTLESLGFFDLHLHYDATGRAEGNLWKFVHLLKTFERERGANLNRFVNEAERPERMDKTVDAPGSVEPNKINIMTVHAAKGLQFDYVFLPFLGKDPYNENKRDFPVDEAEKKWSVRAPASETEHKSSASLFEKKVIQDFKDRQSEEDLRVFYVAYTRAKKQIYFSWSKDPGKNSWAKKLEQFEKESGTHQGDNFTYTVKQVDDIMPSPVTAASIADRHIAKPFHGTRLRDWTPSHSEDHAVTKILEGEKPFRPLNYKNAFIKKTQGILFHKLLEIIKYPTEKDIAQLVTEWFPNAEENVGEALNFALALQDPPLIELIKTGNVEWSFRTKKMQGHRDLEGQIDLWGISNNILWIVDYKSGEKVLKDKAFQQLKVYASAVKDYLNWQGEIKLAVVYPFLQESYVQPITEKDLIF